jgi:hypothetical protein
MYRAVGGDCPPHFKYLEAEKEDSEEKELRTHHTKNKKMPLALLQV